MFFDRNRINLFYDFKHPSLYSLKNDGNVFFAGQLSGVEGYMESAASGILSGYNAYAYIKGENPLILPKTTMIGAIIDYITDSQTKKFQPMGANFGLLPPLNERIRDKKERYLSLANRGLDDFDKTLTEFKNNNKRKNENEDNC